MYLGSKLMSYPKELLCVYVYLTSFIKISFGSNLKTTRQHYFYLLPKDLV